MASLVVFFLVVVKEKSNRGEDLDSQRQSRKLPGGNNNLPIGKAENNSDLVHITVKTYPRGDSITY